MTTITLDIHLVRVVAKPLLNYRHKKERRRCCAFEFSSEALNARPYDRPIEALDAFSQNLSSIVFFDDASSYIPLSEPNKRNTQLFVLISPDYREKCIVYMYLNKHGRQKS